MSFTEVGLRLLHEQREIHLEGKINHDQFLHVQDALLRLRVDSSPDFKIYITSEGGCTRAALKICTMLKEYSGKIHGIVESHALSSASVILQYCDHRTIHEEAELLFHYGKMHPTINVGVMLDARKIKDRIGKEVKNSRILFERVNRQAISKFKGSKSEYLELLDKDENLGSEEALELGFVDEIVRL